MGGAVRKMANTFKNYNIESKTAKYLAKDKPEMAPRHPMSRKISLDDAYVNTDIAFKEKSEDLGNKLQNVKVDSHGPPPPILRSITSGPLPVDRKRREFSYPTTATSKSAMEGKADLSTIIEFIRLHQDNPQGYTAQDIAREHKLKLANVEQVLEHFKFMKLHMSAKLKSQYDQADVPKKVQTQVDDVLLQTGRTKIDKNVRKPELINVNLGIKDGKS